MDLDQDQIEGIVIGVCAAGLVLAAAGLIYLLWG